MNKITEDLRLLIEEEIKQGAFPGANYVIVTKNKTYFDSIGNRSLFPKVVENSLDTLYDLASLSKVIATTTCLYKLMELGLIRTNTKVQTYLPRFIHPDITIWHLMTHTSGLPEGVTGLINLKTKEEIIDKIYSLPLNFIPGTKISYSDVGYILLGLIIEQIMKKPLDIVTKELVFDPLEMTHTTYNPTTNNCAPTEMKKDFLNRNLVCGVVHDEIAYLFNGVAGHAGVFSTVQDLSHFMLMVLNDGLYQDKRYLSKSSIDLMYKIQVKETTGIATDGLNRGLGWIIGGSTGPNGDLTSPKTIHHTGFTGTSIWIDYQNQIGFCLLTNRVHPTRENQLHLNARARLANYVMAHLEDFK